MRFLTNSTNATSEMNTRVAVTPEQAWNLDSYLAAVIAAGVRRLKEESHGHPNGTTPEEWDRTLNQMADAFERYAARWDRDDPYDEVPGFAEALGLFTKHFTDLWD